MNLAEDSLGLEVFIHSDGACSGNPGPGGWGAVLACPALSLRREISGAEAETTNNRMELTAVIQALASLKRSCRVRVTTDSRYVVNAFREGWVKKWQRNGWQNAARRPVKNVDLWKELILLAQRHQVAWEWIRGHAGNPENERADRLAVSARERLTSP